MFSLSSITGFFSGFELKAIIALVLALGLTSGGFYLYYRINSLELTVAQQNTQIQSDKTSIQTLTDAQKILTAAAQIQQQGLQTLNGQFNQIQAQSNQLSQTLAKHDLEQLAAAKPGLIENDVNKATQAILDQFKQLSEPDNAKQTP